MDDTGMKICLNTNLSFKGKVLIETDRIDYVVAAEKRVENRVGGYDTGAKYDQHTYMVKIILGNSLLIAYVDTEEKSDALVRLLTNPTEAGYDEFSITGYSEYSEKRPQL